ncbi:MAG TPA: LysE family transporter [Candidatus Ventrimonas merdavium]|nr:LysE family transporter [Candidatus Ventrimonas merdavium]
MFPVSDFLIYCFITAYTPGANNLLSMSNAARLGFRKSVRFNWGITAGFFLVMCGCTLFSSVLYSALPKVKWFMQIFGAGYMLYLAWKIGSSHGDLEIEQEKTAGFFAGMVLQFMNPKIYIYAITTMSLYILPVFHSAAALAGFTLVLTVIGASGSFVWALFGSAFCRFFARHTKAVNWIMAGLLVYCAVSLFL